jgi:hypothetical protein
MVRFSVILSLVVDRPRRRSPAVRAALAAGLLLALALAGLHELALYLAPLAAIGVLVGSGVFLAEERIVAGWTGARRVAPSARRRRTRWQAAREHALTSLLERSPARRRGPPVAVQLVLN